MEDTPSFQELFKSQIYTVSGLNARIKETIEEELGFEYVWVTGEISRSIPGVRRFLLSGLLKTILETDPSSSTISSFLSGMRASGVGIKD
jgi:hypothetical protein